MESRTTFLCPFCIKTQKIFDFNLHMTEHARDYDKDGNPLILSKNLEDLVLRFSKVGFTV